MHVSGYAAKRDTVIGHGALWFPVVRRLFWVVLTPHAARHIIGYFFHGFVDVIGYEASGIWFYCFIHTLCH